MSDESDSTSDRRAASNVINIFTREAVLLAPPPPRPQAPRLGATCNFCGEHAYPQDIVARVRAHAEQLLDERYPRTRTVEAAVREYRHELRTIVALSNGYCPGEHAALTLEMESCVNDEENMLYNDAVRRRRAREAARTQRTRTRERAAKR